MDEGQRTGPGSIAVAVVVAVAYLVVFYRWQHHRYRTAT